MAVKDNEYSVEALLGNTTVDRNVLATIRSTLARTDPSVSSNFPFYPNVSGKTLRITYTKEVSTVVTDVVVDIALSSNSMADIMTTINAVDPTNLVALDLGGYLAVQDNNAGKTHRIEVNPYTITPANDAAPALGFTVTPLPGSISYVNELASAPGNRKESNPQGTALLTSGEDITNHAVNRPFVALLQVLERAGIDLDRLVIGFKEKSLSFILQVASGLYYAALSDDTIRIPIYDPGLSIDPRERYFKILAASSGRPVPSVLTSSVTVGGFVADKFIENFVIDAVYGTSGTTITPNAAAFTAWGTPDGKTIFGTAVPNKDKQASTAVTSITGNVVYCAGATFVTKKVASGDPVLFAASTLTPFDHSGWFAVTKVYDETHIAVRPMGPGEQTPTVAAKPTSLNPSAGGTLRVAVGFFIPAGSVLLVVNNAAALSGAVVRIASAMPLREALAADIANMHEGDINGILALVNTHLARISADAHPAIAIKGFNTTNTWQDGTVITETAGNLKNVIEDIVGQLGSHLAAGGSAKVGSEAISIGGATPNTVAAGSVLSQIIAVLTDLQTHVNQTTGAHPATAIAYAGGGNWADGTTNPAATVEAQLDKIISDLAGAAGTGKIAGSAVGSDLIAETLALQISDLVNNWFKLSRNNTVTGQNLFSALQTLNGASDSTFAVLTSTPPNFSSGLPKPLWDIVLDASAGIHAQVYSTLSKVALSSQPDAGGLMILVNATVTGLSGANYTYARQSATWTSTKNADAIRMFIGLSGVNGPFLRVEKFAAHTTATWNDGNWVNLFQVGAVSSTPNISGDIYLDNNGNIILSGSGHILRGLRNTVVPIIGLDGWCSVQSGGGPSWTGASWGFTQPASSTTFYLIQIPSIDNKILTVHQVLVRNSMAGTGTVTWGLVTGETVFGTIGSPITTGQSPSNGIASGVTLTPAPAYQSSSAGETLWLSCTTPSTATGKIYSVELITSVDT